MTCSKKVKKPKPKTHKSIFKRVKISANGKVLLNRPGRRHLAISKTAKRRRHLRNKMVLKGKVAKNIRSAALGHY